MAMTHTRVRARYFGLDRTVTVGDPNDPPPYTIAPSTSLDRPIDTDKPRPRQDRPGVVPTTRHVEPAPNALTPCPINRPSARATLWLYDLRANCTGGAVCCGVPARLGSVARPRRLTAQPRLDHHDRRPRRHPSTRQRPLELPRLTCRPRRAESTPGPTWRRLYDTTRRAFAPCLTNCPSAPVTLRPGPRLTWIRTGPAGQATAPLLRRATLDMWLEPNPFNPHGLIERWDPPSSRLFTQTSPDHARIDLASSLRPNTSSSRPTPSFRVPRIARASNDAQALPPPLPVRGSNQSGSEPVGRRLESPTGDSMHLGPCHVPTRPFDRSIAGRTAACPVRPLPAIRGRRATHEVWLEPNRIESIESSETTRRGDPDTVPNDPTRRAVAPRQYNLPERIDNAPALPQPLLSVRTRQYATPAWLESTQLDRIESNKALGLPQRCDPRNDVSRDRSASPGHA
ncbi:hypothetical protein BDV93DRAFT_580839 [Ceratobasidium sp. AG-I]|nr:hypothetical protein BDV93DRAFT_580839 [Ceratobasidium sp. AG-I]